MFSSPFFFFTSSSSVLPSLIFRVALSLSLLRRILTQFSSEDSFMALPPSIFLISALSTQPVPNFSLRKFRSLPSSFPGTLPQSNTHSPNTHSLIFSLLTIFPSFLSTSIITSICVISPFPVDVVTIAGLPLVIWENITAPLMPMPCCPRDCIWRWSLVPASILPNTLGIYSSGMPEALSWITTLKCSDSSLTRLISTEIFGSTPASSAASMALVTPSWMTVVSERILPV
ncbi:hypothetical protein ES703_83151 [subsurface metagenome]